MRKKTVWGEGGYIEELTMEGKKASGELEGGRNSREVKNGGGGGNQRSLFSSCDADRLTGSSHPSL